MTSLKIIRGNTSLSFVIGVGFSGCKSTRQTMEPDTINRTAINRFLGFSLSQENDSRESGDTRFEHYESRHPFPVIMTVNKEQIPASKTIQESHPKSN